MTEEALVDITPGLLILAFVLFWPTVYLVGVCGYLALLTLGATVYRPKTCPDTPPLRFALLIPAHNEEAHIQRILADARALDYPAAQFDVFVIADNCGDATAERAAAAGAIVLERSDPNHPGKGQALDWALRSERARFAAYDAIAIVDADMDIEPGFLRELSATLSEEGVEVAQALNTVANPTSSWRAAIGYASFTLINYVRPAGRCMLGGTAELKGSGMAFRSGLLLERGWPAHSLTEDVEFSKQLLLDGILVRFNPRAKVTSAIAGDSRQAEVQQQRWEGGRFLVFKKYFWILVRAALERPSLARFDAVMDVLVAPVTLLVVLLAPSLGASILVSPVWTAILAACAAALVFSVCAGLLLVRAPFKVWLYLITAPVFVFWKIPVLLRLGSRRGPKRWQRTPRDEEL